jgi:type III pantothenate kinase
MSPPAAPVLAIDAGNTRVKWGLHADGRWAAQGSLATAEAAGIEREWPPIPDQAIAIASNVAGAEVARHLEAACRRRRLALAFVASPAAGLGVTNGYRDPAQLGTDRWAALVAAHHLHPGHKLVVNAGTALTIDALAADGRFLGGVIVPGPTLMRRSLDRGTAALRQTEGAFAPFPASTPDAITSGALQACVGAIERLRASMAAEGLADARIVLAGGAAGELAAHLSPAPAIEDNLVLEGLLRIARR